MSEVPLYIYAQPYVTQTEGRRLKRAAQRRATCPVFNNPLSLSSLLSLQVLEP